MKKYVSTNLVEQKYINNQVFINTEDIKTLKDIVPSDKFEPTQKKMDMFSNAKGTILFFENTQIIEQLKIDYPLYKDQFDNFALRGMGILQGNIWNALAEAEIGASLQRAFCLVPSGANSCVH